MMHLFHLIPGDLPVFQGYEPVRPAHDIGVMRRKNESHPRFLILSTGTAACVGHQVMFSRVAAEFGLDPTDVAPQRGN